ncbi:MAG: hypothetical protein RSD94_15675, partial [Acinetobacter sp.]
MKMGNVVRVIAAAISLCVISGCTKKIPLQVIYHYDDNRYLELKGFNCDGALWYHDVKRNIHKELIDGVFASFRIFT